MSLKKRKIKATTGDDLVFFRVLQLQVRPQRENAEHLGFLLESSDPGETEDLHRTAVCRTLWQDASPVAFLVALQPEHPRLLSLLENKARFELEPQDILTTEPLMWIAKIAVVPELARQGAGTALYKHLFEEFPRVHFLTATLRAPLRNYPSEAFHMKLGFQEVGSIKMGDRSGLKDCVAAVYYRAWSPEHETS